MSHSTYTTHSEQETKNLAAKFSRTFHGGEVIFLEGDLGSGKTTFVRGVAEALGYFDPVRSPSFTIVNRYRIEHPTIKQILHVDLYRLKDASELTALALEDELAHPDTVAFVEWPSLLADFFPVPSVVIACTAFSTGEHRFDITLPPPPRARVHQRS